MHPKGTPTRLIPLSQGLWTLVDADDYPSLIPHTWTGGPYAHRVKSLRGQPVTIFMHRVIMALAPGHVPEVDHINGDTLDNRRCNLRLATRAQQVRNTRMRSNNTSGFRGVWVHKPGSWAASIRVDRHLRYLGLFGDPADAARAYDAAATLYHGEFASLNFPHQP